jgi:hypothetical protein
MGAPKSSKGIGEMKWFSEFAIDDSGRCLWREGMRVTEGPLYDAYQQSTLVQFIVETSAIMGVKVGQA